MSLRAAVQVAMEDLEKGLKGKNVLQFSMQDAVEILRDGLAAQRAQERGVDLLKTVKALLGCTELNLDDMEPGSMREIRKAALLLSEIERGT